MDVYLVNESTLLNRDQAWNIAWALNYQAQYHFGRAGWRSDIRCVFADNGPNTTIPAGSAVLHLLDTSDQPGALGYHDEDGNEIPFGRVFVKTALDDGDAPSEVASHELLELAADPNVNLTAPDASLKRLYAVEVGDPCQGNAYDVGEPEGRSTGIAVADFTRPNYFDPNTKATTVTDFRGALKGPFALGPQGYFSFIDLSNVNAGWQQKVGSERTKPVPPDHDRLLRRRPPWPQQGLANL